LVIVVLPGGYAAADTLGASAVGAAAVGDAAETVVVRAAAARAAEPSTETAARDLRIIAISFLVSDVDES
jgi:hypothetical protein